MVGQMQGEMDDAAAGSKRVWYLRLGPAGSPEGWPCRDAQRLYSCAMPFNRKQVPRIAKRIASPALRLTRYLPRRFVNYHSHSEDLWENGCRAGRCLCHTMLGALTVVWEQHQHHVAKSQSPVNMPPTAPQPEAATRVRRETQGLAPAFGATTPNQVTSYSLAEAWRPWLQRHTASSLADYWPPAHWPTMDCTCCSAWADSSAKRTPTREECFMNFSQHRCTHCREGTTAVSPTQRRGRRSMVSHGHK